MAGAVGDVQTAFDVANSAEKTTMENTGDHAVRQRHALLYILNGLPVRAYPGVKETVHNDNTSPTTMDTWTNSEKESACPLCIRNRVVRMGTREHTYQQCQCLAGVRQTALRTAAEAVAALEDLADTDATVEKVLDAFKAAAANTRLAGETADIRDTIANGGGDDSESDEPAHADSTTEATRDTNEVITVDSDSEGDDDADEGIDDGHQDGCAEDNSSRPARELDTSEDAIGHAIGLWAGVINRGKTIKWLKAFSKEDEEPLSDTAAGMVFKHIVFYLQKAGSAVWAEYGHQVGLARAVEETQT